MAHKSDRYYEYTTGDVIVCGECLDADLLATKIGRLTGDEVVRQGMFRRLNDDHTEPYQCDKCLKQNAPYELLGEEL